MHADVAQIIHGNNRPRFQLTLHASVHLIGARGLIIGRVQRYAGYRRARCQSVGYISAVGLSARLRRGLLELLLQCNDLGYDIPDGLAAKRQGVHHSAVRKIECAARTNILRQVEKTGGQTTRPIKQHVVEDCIFIVDARAGANRGFSIFPGIPGKTQSSAHIVVGLVYAAAKSWANLIQQVAGAADRRRIGAGNGPEIRVGATRVAVVAHAIDEGKVRLHLPRVTQIGLKTRIILSAAVLAKVVDFRKTALPVTQADAAYGVVQGIRSPAGERTACGGRLRVRSKGGANRRINPVKAREAPAKNAVIAHTVTEDMAAKHFRTVVLELFVRLIGFLRSQDIRARAEHFARSGATGAAVADVHHHAGRHVDDVRAGDGVGDAVAE